VKFKVPLNGHVEDLEDGRPVAPGEEVDFTKKELEESDHNRRLVAEGRLIGASDAAVKLAAELAEEAASTDEPSVPASALDVNKLPGAPDAEGGS